MRESLGSNMEKYTCSLEGQNSRLSITYNFSPKIIFRQLWKACQKLWKGAIGRGIFRVILSHH